MLTTAVSLTPARVWWSAVRPATLAASVAPVLAGTAVAIHEGGIRPAAGFAALLVAVAMQIGVNFANDYSDFVRGADTPRRMGPVRASASGVVAPEQVRLAALVAFGVAGIAGLVLSLATDWRLLALGAACLLAARADPAAEVAVLWRRLSLPAFTGYGRWDPGQPRSPSLKRCFR